jgi:hypothetical protein
VHAAHPHAPHPRIPAHAKRPHPARRDGAVRWSRSDQSTEAGLCGDGGDAGVCGEAGETGLGGVAGLAGLGGVAGDTADGGVTGDAAVGGVFGVLGLTTLGVAVGVAAGVETSTVVEVAALGMRLRFVSLELEMLASPESSDWCEPTAFAAVTAPNPVMPSPRVEAAPMATHFLRLLLSIVLSLSPVGLRSGSVAVPVTTFPAGDETTRRTA